MSDPCNECLIYSACSQACEPKLKYVESFNKQLEGMAPHLYTQNGHGRRKKNIPLHIQKQHLAIIKKIEQQQARVREIFYRGRITFE